MAAAKKIVIVEDDLFVRDLYERQFKQEGFEVSVAVDGEEGVNKISKEVPDLILLDLMLPKMNGLDVLKTIKEKPETKNIPVVVLTNLGQDEAIKQCFELGANGYLVKSAYTPTQVVSEVKTYIK
ncbi:MAG: response regulator [Patescibacteria group bacterium]|nr:response regulator [Patescibacteria group bacterium]